MLIGGIQKSSLIDYPGQITAIIFTQGCPFKCPYCHNPELVVPDCFQSPISEDEIFDFLESRIGKLDAVTITGGEPTLHKDLDKFIAKIKKMGFLVKLDSNGSNPEFLQRLINENLIDYIAMDIKGPLDKYHSISNSKISIDNIRLSVEMIMSSGIDYEFRTTIVKSLLDKDDFHKIGELIKNARLYALQKFIPTKLIDENFNSESTYSDEEFEELKEILLQYVNECQIR